MKKIYIACPGQCASGGPELLHQLCNKLNKLGYDASQYYYNNNEGYPVHKRYEEYKNPYVTEVKDDENNLIIMPEVALDFLYNFPKSQKVIWWLSVDNYIKDVDTFKKKIKALIGKKPYNIRQKNLIHLVQSQYAYDFLEKKKVDKERIYYLSDYLNKVFIEESRNANFEKQDYVLYNPLKGREFTEKIIAKSKDLNWKALQGLTPKEMAELLQKSKVYIDFGNHPGKDRIPREAAISGCCVITGMRGAAKFKEDVNIPDEFKFKDEDSNLDKIVAKIRELINNYDENRVKFDEYRQIIINEESKFESDVEKIFSIIAK